MNYKPKIWKNVDECYPKWWKTPHKWIDLGIIWVDVDKIIGTNDTKWFVESRFKRAVELFQSKKYNFDHPSPPHLTKIKDEYFIESGGTHRVLAAKYCKIAKIKAEVVEVIFDKN